MIDQPDPVGFFRGYTCAGVEQFQCAPQRNDAWQALRPAGARQPAQTHFAEPELGVLRGHANIAGEGLFQTAAVGVAVDCGDDGFVQVEQDGKQIRVLVLGPVDVVGFHVAARAERALARTGQNAHAQGRVIPKFGPNVRQRVVRFEVASIQALGPVDRHVGNLPLLLEQYFRHASLLGREREIHRQLSARTAAGQGRR